MPRLQSELTFRRSRRPLWGKPNICVTSRKVAALLGRNFVGWTGAHSQGATLDELRENLREVVAMLLEDGDPRLEAEFIGTRSIAV